MPTLTVRSLAIAAGAALFSLSGSPAQAFWGHHRTVVAYPSVPVVAGYAPVTVARPVVVASPIVVASPVVTANYVPAPVTTYYAPAAPVVAPVTTTYYAPAAPVTTYYAPAPVTSYYAPAAPVVAPVTTYYAPAVAAPVIRARRVVLRPW